MITLLETKLPQDIRKKYTDNKPAQSMLDLATRFHEAYGILPSIRCRKLAEDLENIDDISKGELAEKYNFKEGRIKDLDHTSAELVAHFLRKDIIPRYEECEKPFTSRLKLAFQRFVKRKEYDISRSIGTPFVRLRLDNRYCRFSLEPTSPNLYKEYLHKYDLCMQPHGICWLQVEHARAGQMLVNELQRARFLGGSNKQPFAPFGILEQLFLLVIAFSKCREVFLPGSVTIFERYEDVFRRKGKELGTRISESEFRVYDALGQRYGENTKKIPDTEFVRKICAIKGVDKVPGWKIDLR